jgi:hypothetical protein
MYKANRQAGGNSGESMGLERPFGAWPGEGLTVCRQRLWLCDVAPHKTEWPLQGDLRTQCGWHQGVAPVRLFVPRHWNWNWNQVTGERSEGNKQTNERTLLVFCRVTCVRLWWLWGEGENGQQTNAKEKEKCTSVKRTRINRRKFVNKYK